MNDIDILALHEHGSASPAEVRALCMELGQLRYQLANVRSVVKSWEKLSADTLIELAVAENRLHLIEELATDPEWKKNPKYIMINDLLDILNGQVIARVSIPAGSLEVGTIIHMNSGATTTLTCPHCAESYRVDERHLCFDDVRRIENDHG